MTEEFKLIVEDIPDTVFEQKIEKIEQDLYIVGCAAQSGVINGNGRLYPRKVLYEAMNEYVDKYVAKNKALGELNHPARPYADPKQASHRITEMWMEGDNVMAKALVLETTNGNELRALIKGGWQVQASTRGMGVPKLVKGMNESKTYNEIVKYKMTVGFDVVQDQSAPGAIMAGIYECQNGIYVPTEEANNADWDEVFRIISKHYKISQ